MPYSPIQIKSMMQSLPDDVKEAIASVDSLDVILGLEKKHKLHFDQTGQLSDEILLLTVGITPPQQFISNIQRRMGITKEVAQDIGVEVNEKIFRPIRDSLKQIHNMKAEMEKIQETPEKTTLEFPKNEADFTSPFAPAENEPEKTDKPLPESPIFTEDEKKPEPEIAPMVPAQDIPIAPATPPTTPETPKPEVKNIAETKLEKPFNIASKTTVDPYREPIN